MQNRILPGRLAFSGAVCLLITGMLTGCGGGSGTPTSPVRLAVAPTSISVVQGQSADTTGTLWANNGFSSPVNLSVSGLPTGATAQFYPATVTPTVNGTNVELTIYTSLATPGSQAVVSTPPGTYNVTVTATVAGTTKQTTMTVVVTSAN